MMVTALIRAPQGTMPLPVRPAQPRALALSWVSCPRCMRTSAGRTRLFAPGRCLTNQRYPRSGDSRSLESRPHQPWDARKWRPRNGDSHQSSLLLALSSSPPPRVWPPSRPALQSLRRHLHSASRRHHHHQQSGGSRNSPGANPRRKALPRPRGLRPARARASTSTSSHPRSVPRSAPRSALPRTAPTTASSKSPPTRPLSPASPP